MMWVSPDGTVYLWPPWEGPPDAENLANIDPIQPKSPLDDAKAWLNGKADRELKEAKARYWNAKAKSEERKSWGL
jgi:hypothetical protein